MSELKSLIMHESTWRTNLIRKIQIDRLDNLWDVAREQENVDAMKRILKIKEKKLRQIAFAHMSMYSGCKL